MTRKIVVTSALPYANGSIHIGHLVEYIQTDIWVRFQKLCGNECHYFCADDTHGTPVMISALKAGITPEELVEKMHIEHSRDFDAFDIKFDNYYSTHSPENRELSELIFQRLSKAGSIIKKTVEQAYCSKCKMYLPDRYIRGTCPKCQALDQYGDSCEICSTTYHPTDLIDPKCSICGDNPIRKESEHYFFKLTDYQQRLEDLIGAGYTQQSVANKLDEWFKAGLKDWDISRDGPYFGFKIPGEDDKFFYVWLDAPIGYMASAKNYCDSHTLDFEEVFNSDRYELYHFLGKDIMYFHALFWPAMLMGSGFRTANKIFVHGFLTVDGAKMSKSRGTFIKAETYARSLNPEYLRYYYASKLTSGVEDIDLNFEDFTNRINSNLVGKLANLASRSGPMLTKKFESKLGKLDDAGMELLKELTAEKDSIIADYENLDYASAVRKIVALADIANRYVENNQPWVTIKTDTPATLATLTATVNAVKILTTYLKPILPIYTEKVEKFLNNGQLDFSNITETLQDHTINKFERLIDRVDKDKVSAMIEESRELQPVQQEQKPLSEPLADECTIDDFAKCDLRIAKVISAESVEGADKLLHLKLDIGGIEKNVFAGISKAYSPQQLEGKMVICLANLKPRKMKFGVSEGMILAAGSGGSDLFVLTVDDGAKPGQRVS